MTEPKTFTPGDKLRAIAASHPAAWWDVIVQQADVLDDLYAACKAYYYGEKDERECERMMGEALAKAEGR